LTARALSPHSDDLSAELLTLLYPNGLTESQHAEARRIIDRDGVNVTTVRQILGTLDRNTAPTAFQVRPSASDIVTVRVGDLQLALDRADQSVSATIVDAGTWEPHIVEAMRRLLSPGQTFVDVGANVGYHTMVAASIVGPTGAVHAFEANPDNARLIAYSIELNALEHVRLHPVALSDSAGYEWFASAIGSNGGITEHSQGMPPSPSSTVVPAIRLDDVELGRLSMIKIDVEGAEPKVIAGAMETIIRDRPIIVFEFSVAMTEQVAGGTALGHLATIEHLGYELYVIDRATADFIPTGPLTEFLARWGDRYRIEDLIAIPAPSDKV
jgi:FkbM family methyltransferase